MKRPWFDSSTGLLLLDDYVAGSPSFQKIMQDQVVTQEEVEEQGRRTVELLKRLESMLSPEAHEAATEALCELAVFYAVGQMCAAAGR